LPGIFAYLCRQRPIIHWYSLPIGYINSRHPIQAGAINTTRSVVAILQVTELCRVFSLICVGNDPSFTGRVGDPKCNGFHCSRIFESVRFYTAPQTCRPNFLQDISMVFKPGFLHVRVLKFMPGNNFLKCCNVLNFDS